MQTPSSNWPFHLSNTGIDAASQIRTRILLNYLLISCLVLIHDVEHLMSKFSFCIMIETSLNYYQTISNSISKKKKKISISWLLKFDIIRKHIQNYRRGNISLFFIRSAVHEMSLF